MSFSFVKEILRNEICHVMCFAKHVFNLNCQSFRADSYRGQSFVNRNTLRDIDHFAISTPHFNFFLWHKETITGNVTD